ncbi:hypothetical protein AV530_015906 [Patagioenas fasciata monilis]|uniref:Uncharacterized protein n=1 Tax=Patagioenas fasciata monilis TaxID=372326 RepID=A0A1V4KJ58_PATFA|nr:hypothetical protein AV530_015906 [Patagioenas fasciata monilis]
MSSFGARVLRVSGKSRGLGSRPRVSGWWKTSGRATFRPVGGPPNPLPLSLPGRSRAREAPGGGAGLGLSRGRGRGEVAALGLKREEMWSKRACLEALF